MQEKGAFLKRMLNLKSIKLFFIFVFFSLPLASKENITLNSALNYLNSLNEFSSSFLQIQNNEIKEHIFRTINLKDAAEAHTLIESRQSTGSIILKP